MIKIPINTEICKQCNKERLKTTYFRSYNPDTTITIEEIQYCGNCREYFDFSISRENILENLKMEIIQSSNLRAILNSFAIDEINIHRTVWKHYQYEIEIVIYPSSSGVWSTFDNLLKGNLEIDDVDLSELSDQQRNEYAKRLTAISSKRDDDRPIFPM